MPKIISINSRKGGSSRSTSVCFLAMCLYLRCLNSDESPQKSVVCIDYDNELALHKWHTTGNLPFDVVIGNPDDVKSDIAKLKDYSYILLDTPPNDEAIIFKTASVADEVIVPMSPTAMDANRILSTLNTIGTVEELRNKPLTSVLLVKVKQNANILQDIKIMLSERNVPLLDTTISHSVKYQDFATPRYLEQYQAVVDELGL